MRRSTATKDLGIEAVKLCRAMFHYPIGAPRSWPPRCEGPLRKHGHHRPSKLGMAHFHPTSRFAGLMWNGRSSRQYQPLASAGVGRLLKHRGPAIGRTVTSTIPVQSSTCSEMLSASSTSMPR
jgi:hypothetical protein